MSTELRCPQCGYTEQDASFHGDHALCSGRIPVSPKVLGARLRAYQKAFNAVDDIMEYNSISREQFIKIAEDLSSDLLRAG